MMNEGILGTQVVTQIGFIVRDVEKTKKKFAQFLGVKEPDAFWTDDIEKSQAVYRDAPCPAKAKLAFFKVGETLDIELIQPDEKPSVWREFLEENGEGVHHIAFQIKGMKEKITALDKIGMKLQQKGEYTGGRYAYIDSNKDLKVMIELLEND
jgi:catechol 2,3-dioxygenase-like lactoylglutathione lyase family enzyme